MQTIPKYFQLRSQPLHTDIFPTTSSFQRAPFWSVSIRADDRSLVGNSPRNNERIVLLLWKATTRSMLHDLLVNCISLTTDNKGVIENSKEMSNAHSWLQVMLWWIHEVSWLPVQRHVTEALLAGQFDSIFLIIGSYKRSFAYTHRLRYETVVNVVVSSTQLLQ